MKAFFHFGVAASSLSLLLSCSGAKLDADTSKGNAAPSASQQPDKEKLEVPSSPSDTSTLNPTSEESQLAAEAQPPAIVAGAYLTCAVENDVADCKAFDRNNTAYDFAGTAAYVIDGSPLKWTKASFNQLGTGHWQVPLPTPIPAKFAIALSNDKKDILADWIIRSADVPTNLVADHSFESFVVDAPAVYQYFPNSDASAWKTRLPDTGATCVVPLLEVQTSAAFAPADGNNSIELNSGCKTEGVDTTAPNRVMVYQPLNAIPGHLYEIKFMAAMRVRASKFSVGFGGDLLFQKELTSSVWSEFSAVVAAKTANPSIEFQDLVDNGTVRGTMVDNVFVYDLGTGPE